MFYYLNGILTYRDASTCVIDCNGVGYKLTVSAITADSVGANMGKQVKLYTYLAVREDGIELFGFGSNAERECFNKLITVSGVGPKAAMSILSVMTPDTLALVISTDDVKAISKAPGIGAKTAARIILELKDKVSKEMMDAGIPTSAKGGAAQKAAMTPVMSMAVEGLMVLGYDKASVTNALKDCDPKISDPGELIRLALKKLSR